MARGQPLALGRDAAGARDTASPDASGGVSPWPELSRRVQPTRSDRLAAAVQIEVTNEPLAEVAAQSLAFAVPDPMDQLSGPAGEIDGVLGGQLAKLSAAGDLRAEPNAVCVVHTNGRLAADRVVVCGLGKLERLDSDSLRDAAAAAARAVAKIGGTLAFVLDPSLPLPLDEQARAVVDGVVLGSYDPGRWKTSGSRPKPIERLLVVGGDAAAAERAGRIAEWANRARDLANRPPNDLTPEALAARAEEIGGEVEHMKVETVDRKGIEKLGMGAFAAVAQGSDVEPRLIVMRYDPPSAHENVTLGLVGKAITFDTGGISLKPGLGMEEMKGDMCGGGAVIEGMGALAELGVPLKTLAVVTATENMPSGHAFRPGDILTAANGKTIEIVNTDAEGRLVLADGLWYAREQGATHVVDFATLTGAMTVALGDIYAGVYANDTDWGERVVAAGEATGDHAWLLPLHRRYRRYVDSTFADLKNSSTMRQAGSALAAEFLKEFAGDGPWAHVDIAGTAFLPRSRGDYLTQPGGTGYGVRLIVELASRLAG